MTRFVRLFWLGLWITATVTTATGCGDAYSSHVPSQKLSVELYLDPPSVTPGQIIEVHAITFTPTSTNYFTDYSFGSGISIINFDAGPMGEGCDRVRDLGIEVPSHLQGWHIFPICMDLNIAPEPALGQRNVWLGLESLESDDPPIVARGLFFLEPEPPGNFD